MMNLLMVTLSYPPIRRTEAGDRGSLVLMGGSPFRVVRSRNNNNNDRMRHFPYYQLSRQEMNATPPYDVRR